jgi:DNA polymerase-3 subunit gamma/tau
LSKTTRDIKLLIEVKSCLRLVSYAPGRIELEPTENAPRDLINRLKRMLQEATGVHGPVRRHRRRAHDHRGRGHRRRPR